MNRKKSTLKFLFSWVLILALAYALVLGWQIWHYPTMNAPSPKSDFAVILGATTRGENPSPVFKERVQEGIRLYQSGKVKKLIFTGKPGNPPQALVGKNLALQAGVPETDILVETQSLNTLENLIYARHILSIPSHSTLLIVSDPLHLKRAILIAEDLGMKAHPAPTQSTRFQSMGNRLKFLVREILAYSKYQVQRTFRIPQRKAKKIQNSLGS